MSFRYFIYNKKYYAIPYSFDKVFIISKYTLILQDLSICPYHIYYFNIFSSGYSNKYKLIWLAWSWQVLFQLSWLCNQNTSCDKSFGKMDFVSNCSTYNS